MWRSKTGSTGKFTFEVYYDLLWNGAYQHDLNKTTKQPQSKALSSHQSDLADDLEYDPDEEESTDDQDQDALHHTQSFNPPPPILLDLRATKTDIHPQIWRQFPESVNADGD